jgi:hypothetical protein
VERPLAFCPFGLDAPDLGETLVDIERPERAWPFPL